jgi:hypothetical protein
VAQCLELLLKKAEDAYRRNDLNSAWSLLLEAQRSEIGALSPEQRKARAVALRAEAEVKLPDWRKRAVLKLLDDKDDKAEVTADQLNEATQLRNEHSHNQYHKLDLAREQLVFLMPILVVALVGLLAVVGRGLIQIRDLDWLDLLTLMILGALGGALSAVRSLAGRPDRRIPDQLADRPVTALRPLLGAAAATGVALMVQAGVVSFGSSDNQDLALLAVAFLAGFSERWFLGMIGSLPGGSTERE